jgi:hypothetical protein
MRNLSDISAVKFAHVQGSIALAVDEKVQININTWKIDHRVKRLPRRRRSSAEANTSAVKLTSLTVQAP